MPRIEPTAPKTTQPSARKQREKPERVTAAERLHKNLDAFPDRIDVRDWFYQPTLQALPQQVINCSKVPMVLDQGTEGACTGFALAAVVNYHLVNNGRLPRRGIKNTCVSPRMLYEMARRYDEWPGEDYVGSSARGTIKGWNAHGVVKQANWTDEMTGPEHLNDDLAKEGLAVPAGAYYRVMHREIRDMHAALHEAGILYATLMVHKGWAAPEQTGKPKTYSLGGKQSIKLPVIERLGKADSGHAVAIVGYTSDGFIIQNSWGPTWGAKGFAILPYEDWLLHSSDCWVVQLGVPINLDLWNQRQAADTAAGRQRASQAIPLEQIRPYVINIGNNGFLSDSGDYWTTESDIDRLFASIEETAAAAGWQKRRIMLYLHGGLNSEKDVAKRIISFKQVCLDNQIYPVHIMWETDFWNSLKGNLFDIFSNEDRASANWLSRLRDETIEIKDRTFELTASKLGTMLWDEMKENAALASAPPTGKPNERLRAIALLANKGRKAYELLKPDAKTKWEVHVVAHSAGAIFTAYSLQTLLGIGIPIRSMQFMAPAISVELFKEKMLPLIKTNSALRPTLYLLSDKGERDDDVGPYGKSLLYLVSNAFERARGKHLLGMQRFVQKLKDDDVMPDAAVLQLFASPQNGWPCVVVSGAADAHEEIGHSISRSDSHGGFDNDHFTLNSVLYRILGAKPKRPFEVRDLQ